MAKDYIYNGEKFYVEDTDACEIKVSDDKHTLSITLNTGGPSVYRVSTVAGGWWWHTNTVEESINRACRDLLDSRDSISQEKACEDMHEYVKNL